MPRSKKAKLVHLSKVEKKGKALSVKLYGDVQNAATTYRNCFVFSVDNMRNNYLKGCADRVSREQVHTFPPFTLTS